MGKSDSPYTGLPWADAFCPKTLMVNPSQTMENDNITYNPIIISASAALIFIFTLLVFLFYDLLVARRQRIVNNGNTG
jgi:hypothetical protein